MKDMFWEMFKRLGEYLLGLVGLILIGAAAFLVVGGLVWIFEKTLPQKVILPIGILCFITVCIAVWLSDRAKERRVKEERKREEANERIVMSLRSDLLHGENKEARIRAVNELNELAKLGSLRAAEALCEALVHPTQKDDELKAYVSDTLVSIGDKAVWELGLMLYGKGGGSAAVRILLASTLGRIATPAAFKELCDLLTRGDIDDGLRACVFDTLVSIGSPAVEQLCLTLNQKDCVRAYAAAALGEIGDARAIESLLKRLRRIDNPIYRFVSWAFAEAERVEPLGYGETTWDSEVESLRKALVKCGWTPARTNTGTEKEKLASDQSVKYFIKRPNETEEFSFVATFQEIKAGLKSGRIKPGWGVKKESGGYWSTIHELLHAKPREIITHTMPGATMKAKILVIALGAFILTCLFPPWQFSADRNGKYGFHTRKPAGYYLIFAPPLNPDAKTDWSSDWHGVQIDFGRLFIEWAALAAITGIVWQFVVKPSRTRDDKSNRPQKFTLPPGNPQN